MNYQDKLIDIAKRNEKLIVITAENRAAIRNLPNIIPDQFLDIGIAEQTMIGVAAGMALRGRIPVVHALATFLTMRAFEFIRTDIGIPSLPVKMAGAVPGFLSEANGPTHQAIEDISIMRGIPPVRIFCPSDEEELVEALPAIIDDPYPYYIRFNNSKPVAKHSPFRIGQAEILKTGDITILTYGFLLSEAVLATEILETEGISAGIVNMRMLKPIDEEQILSIIERSSLIITFEDHFITGGLYSIISELMVKKQMVSNILPIALSNWFKPALLNDVLEYEGFNARALAYKIRSFIQHGQVVMGDRNYGK